MNLSIRPQWAQIGAAAAVVVAAIVAATAAIGAWRLEPLPTGVAHPAVLPEDVTPSPSASSAQFVVLLESDPFHPERRRPDVRFGAAPIDAAIEPVSERSAPTVQLLGTVVLPQQRSLAMCRVGNERARLLRVGDTLSSMKLAEIGQGRAVFVGSRGERLDLTVRKGGT